MQTTYTITSLQPHEIDEACALFQGVFGASITPAHWRWKYQQGPRLGGINLVAKNAQGELLGHCGASVFSGTANQCFIAMAQLCDVMVERTARGVYATNTIYPSLLRAMQNELLQRYPAVFAYGFVGPRPYKLGHRLGYYRAIQPFRTVYSMPNYQKKWRNWIYSVEPIDWNEDFLDAVWARVSPKIKTPSVARTSAYIAWRYRDHPLHQYQLWQVTRLYRSVGWVVTRIMPQGEICIIDTIIPADFSADQIMSAVHQQILKRTGVSVPIASWIGQTDPTHTSDSNVSVEFKLGTGYQLQADPHFQPGDTDVY